MSRRLDPVTLSVLASALVGIAEEMGAVLVRSAYSSNIKERRDCSAALFDADGQMVAQAEHIPVHLGAMPESVAAVIGARAAARRRLHPQRSLPRRHAPARHDARLAARPRRRDRRLRRHARPPLGRRRDEPRLDAGRLARDLSGGPRDPAGTAGARGEPVADVLDLILANVRTPTSAAATCARSWRRTRSRGAPARRARRAARRETVLAAIAEVVDYAERRAREAIARAARRPLQGRPGELEGDGVTEDDIPIACRGDDRRRRADDRLRGHRRPGARATSTARSRSRARPASSRCGRAAARTSRRTPASYAPVDDRRARGLSGQRAQPGGGRRGQRRDEPAHRGHRPAGARRRPSTCRRRGRGR